MRGKIWLLLGIAAGIVLGVARVPYFSGAASTLSDTAQRIVGSGGLSIIHSAAKRGAWHRVVLGIESLLRLLVPGITALLLVAVARLTLRLRVLVGLIVLALGIAGYEYVGKGDATGALIMALGAAAIAVVAIGPFVAAPLAALAALIGTEFLPHLFTDHSVSRSSIDALHRAIFTTPGTPLWLELVMLVVAAVPFAIAARLVVC